MSSVTVHAPLKFKIIYIFVVQAYVGFLYSIRATVLRTQLQRLRSKYMKNTLMRMLSINCYRDVDGKLNFEERRSSKNRRAV